MAGRGVGDGWKECASLGPQSVRESEQGLFAFAEFGGETGEAEEALHRAVDHLAVQPHLVTRQVFAAAPIAPRPGGAGTNGGGWVIGFGGHSGVSGIRVWALPL